MDSFLNLILPKSVPQNEFNEFREVIKSLAFFDSIHDFWPERKTKNAIEDGDEDDIIDMSADRIDAVHKTLEKDSATYLRTNPIPIDDLLKGATNGAISSVSDIENRVMRYFSMKYAPFNTAEAKMTFDEIFQNWRFKKDEWPQYSARILLLSDVVEIVGNGRSVKSLTDEERGILGFFILAYMNPTVQPATDVGFTFDMAPRDIGKIFARFNQVYNYIYPQNIADSASTSFSSLQGRNRFFKADGSRGGTTIGPNVIVRSNLFTWNTHTIEFIDQGFGPENKFGFQISITDNKTGDKHVLQFGKGQEQGPPVNYLMDMIASQRIQGEVPKISTAVRLPPTLPFNSRLLFDLKRMGDHEQMRIDNAYGVTGDRLAGVYRRALRKPGIYHSFSGIRLFRSLAGLTDPQELALRNEKFKCEEVFGKIKILTGFHSQYESVASELSRMKQHVTNGMQYGTVLMDPINIQGADYTTKYTEIAATFATYFLRYRMKDILEHIKKLETKFTSIPTINQLAKDAESLIESINTATVTTDLTPISQNRDALEIQLGNIEQLGKMKIVIDSKDARDPIYVELFQDNGRLKKGVRSDIFNFASGPYLHNETGMQVALARILVHKRSRRLDSIKSTLYENLSLYLAARDAAKEAFFDQTMLDTIETASDIPNGLTLQELIFDPKKGIEGAINRVVGLSAQMGGNGTSGTTPKKQGPKQQSADTKLRTTARQVSKESSYNTRRREFIDKKRVTPPRVLQYRDIHDLFVELCFDSVNGMSLDTLEAKWTLGISDIRMQAFDEYGVSFEESDATDLITYFLSWRDNVDTKVPTPMFGFKGGEIDPLYGMLSDTLFQDLPRQSKGIVTIINFIGGKMLITPNKEKFIRNVLKKFEQLFTKNPNLFEAFGSQGTQNQWSGIPSQLQDFVIEVENDLKYSNTGKNSYSNMNEDDDSNIGEEDSKMNEPPGPPEDIPMKGGRRPLYSRRKTYRRKPRSKKTRKQ